MGLREYLLVWFFRIVAIVIFLYWVNSDLFVGPKISSMPVIGLALVLFGDKIAVLMEGSFSHGSKMKSSPGWLVKGFGWFLLTIFPFLFILLTGESE